MNNMEKILNFILDPIEENVEGYHILYSFFKKYININFKTFKEETDDLFHEFLFKKILNKRDFYYNNFIQNKRELNQKYLMKSFSNFMKDLIKRQKKRLFEDKEKHDSDNEETNDFLEILMLHSEPDRLKDFKVLFAIEIDEINKCLNEYFSVDELKTLCNLFLSTDEKPFKYIEKISDDARYKRRERIKQKLSNFIEKYSFSMEPFDYFVKNKLSEICDSLS